MSFLLDTNVLSETVKRKPNESVLAWLNQTPEDKLYISELSLGEIRKGVERLAPSANKKRLETWLEDDLPHRFGRRILSVDRCVIDRWGRLQARLSRSLPTIDALLAATALYHKLCMVTRNGRDFCDCPDLLLLNPWHVCPRDKAADEGIACSTPG